MMVKISKAQLRALRVCEAHRKVWYEWNQDPKVLDLSRFYGSLGLHKTLTILLRLKLICRAPKPSIFNHTQPFIPTEEGYVVLKANEDVPS